MKRILLTLAVALATFVPASAAADYRLTGRTEHLDAPLGLDACHPRFTWMPDSTCLAPRQQSWHLVVATDSLSAARMQGQLAAD